MSVEASLTIGGLMIILNALFVGAEFGLVSARRSSIEPLALDGSRSAKITLRCMEQVSLALAGAQLGITVTSLILGSVSEPAIASLLEPFMHGLHVSESLIHPIAMIIALAVTVFLHVVIGEMVPKNLALASSVKTALILSPFLYVWMQITRPIIIAMNWLANHTLKTIGITPKNEVDSSFSRDEVAGFVRESGEEGLLSKDEESLLTGVLTFDDLDAKKAFIPIEKVVTVAESATPQEIEALSNKSGYSRFPVLNKRKKLIGYVHIKDIIGLPDATYSAAMSRRIIRPLKAISLTASLKDALYEMQQSTAHLVQVFDRSENVVGIMSLEDIIEEIIGDTK